MQFSKPAGREGIGCHSFQVEKVSKLINYGTTVCSRGQSLKSHVPPIKLILKGQILNHIKILIRKPDSIVMTESNQCYKNFIFKSWPNFKNKNFWLYTWYS